ncbi:MAG: hypothetical protein JWO13_3178 [Acidobacteriales bacterium]|nr:hypothetical protein [Terriglobales bacterium]
MNFQNTRSGSDSEDTSLVPWWSTMLAVAAFVGWQVVTFKIFIPNNPHPRPIAFVLFWSVMVGLFMAFYMLMIGYVNRDARRRGMSPSFWTAIMIFLLASGIGFIVYFLLREPLVLNCPKCEEKVDEEFNFCPRCHYQLNPTCDVCKHGVRLGDIYCAHCGNALEMAALDIVRAR